MEVILEESLTDESGFGNKPLLLVFPYDVMAHYLRCIQLADYLKPWFEIRFLHTERYGAFLEQAGYKTFDCDTLDPVESQKGVQAFDFSWLNEKSLSTIYEDQVRVIGNLRPMAVLGDMAPTLKMAAEKTGVTCITLQNGYLSRYYAEVRRMPRHHPLYKVFNRLPISVYRYLTAIGEKLFFENMHHPFRAIRSGQHLAIKESYTQELEGDLNLICDLPEFFPQHQLPQHCQFIAPLLNKPSDQYADICDKLDPGKKTLFVSMGSTGSWDKVSFLNDSAYEIYNIVTAGDMNRAIQGPHVFSYPFINNADFFQKVDLVICHGGNGTCYQALSYGIPVLAITTHFEQDYNVDGMQRQGWVKGLNDIDKRKYSSLIEETIALKGTEPFEQINERITRSVADFEKSIPDMVAEIIKGIHVERDTDNEYVLPGPLILDGIRNHG